MRALVATVMLLAVAIAGCGGDEEGGSGITYASGGGIDGRGYALEIEPGGAATIDVSLGLEEDRIEFTVPGEELATLAEHLEDADVGSLDEGISEDCFDCFAYSLEYGGDVATADSATVTEEFFAATEPLSRLIDEHLPARYRD